MWTRPIKEYLEDLEENQRWQKEEELLEKLTSAETLEELKLDAVSKLEDSLWYFHTEKRFYSFKNQPNLNRIIVDKEEAIDPDQVRESLYDHLKILQPGPVVASRARGERLR